MGGPERVRVPGGSWAPSNGGGGRRVPGGSWPRGPWAGSEEGRYLGVGRTVLAGKAPRIHAMIASRAGSGLSLPTTGCGILHKEPLLSGSQFPQLSYRKPGPVPLPRCGHTGGQAGTESPLQTVKCRAVCRHSHRGGCAAGRRRPCSGFPSGLTPVRPPTPLPVRSPSLLPPSLPWRSAGSRHAARC